MPLNADFIIVIDKSPSVRQVLEKATGKPSKYFADFQAFEKSMGTLKPLAVFLEVDFEQKSPGYKNGLSLVPTIKKHWPFTPIIVNTSDTYDDAVGESFAAGADDFISKPLNAKEVIARLQARLGDLAKIQDKDMIKVGDLIVDKAHRVISNPKNKQRYLSPTELRLLTCLLDARGTVVKRESIKRQCWGQIYVSDNALNRKLHELRRILKEMSDEISVKTMYGTGFLLEIRQAQTSYPSFEAS